MTFDENIAAIRGALTEIHKDEVVSKEDKKSALEELDSEIQSMIEELEEQEQEDNDDDPS